MTATRLAIIGALLADPTVSDWLKVAVSTGLERDPIDAASDANILAAVLALRARESLHDSVAVETQEQFMSFVAATTIFNIVEQSVARSWLEPERIIEVVQAAIAMGREGA